MDYRPPYQPIGVVTFGRSLVFRCDRDLSPIAGDSRQLSHNPREACSYLMHHSASGRLRHTQLLLDFVRLSW